VRCGGTLADVFTDGRPSETAITTAAGRAAHLMVDREPWVFEDTVARRLLGPEGEAFLDYHLRIGDHPALVGTRTQATTRCRYTEDMLAAAAARGVEQYVLLGAGLDTFAYRSTVHMRVFEVDHPASQAWKRARLAEVGIASTTPAATYVPVDFETDDLAARLAGAGFDPQRPAVVGWLGVTFYLTRAAIRDTLTGLGQLVPGSEVVVEYLLPEPLRDAGGQEYGQMAAEISAKRGEPWITYLRPDEMTALMASAGFDSVEHVGQHDLPYLRERADRLRPTKLSMFAHARR
jgi:methyltransferase (TIGR00027 family)